MEQLTGLDSCRPLTKSVMSAAMMHLETPVKLPVWEAALAQHPDQRFAQYILHGLEHGFRIGFQHGKAPLQQAGYNLQCPEPSIVSEYLSNELKLNRVIKLTKTEARQMKIHISPFGLIPKKNKPGKWRLIIDLSAPDGSSVNDGIERDMISLSYTSVDTIVARVIQLGQGTLLSKMDIRQAYRLVPIHPEDRYLLGMEWQGAVYVDKCLPFRLRTAPLLFSAVADALQWMMQRKGASYVDHYADDFITVGRPGSDECANNTTIMLQVCEETGAPVEEDKSEGPATTLPFLGIEIDTVAMELRLPPEKLHQLLQKLTQWRGKTACTKRELQSIVGSLSHACKVIKPGRSFLRRLIDLSKVAKRPNHHIRLNLEARSDIEWWYRFASTWNGVSMLRRAHPDVQLTSDASGKWGCGAFYDRHWFQLQWQEALQDMHITIKELIPIVLAAAIWGREWTGLTVQARCDNAAVVADLTQEWRRNALAEVVGFHKSQIQVPPSCISYPRQSQRPSGCTLQG